MLGHYFHEFGAQGVHAIPKLLSHSPQPPSCQQCPALGSSNSSAQHKGGAKQQNSIILGIYTLFASQQQQP